MHSPDSRSRADGASWFRALGDAELHPALVAFHAAPGRPWTIALLAREARLSPSRFAARFKDAAGESVMRYVAAWRMNLASRALREEGLSIAQLAAALGYESLPAFTRAFKRIVGTTPAAYRDAQRA